jgi:phosphatidylglycerol:prolipoprotein diacylglycerol transferase
MAMDRAHTAIAIPDGIIDPSIVWGAGFVCAVLWAIRSARRSGVDDRAMYWACGCAIIGGLWGSHLLGLYVYGSDGEPWAWLRVWVGGKSWYGGLIGGAVAALLYFRLRRLPVLRYADALAPAVALGYAIGRIGCFLNGDDYGTLTDVPWAVQYTPGSEAHDAHVARQLIFPSDPLSQPVHPTQLYHTLLGLALLVLLERTRERPAGERLALFVAGYGLGRFLLERWRGDAWAVAGTVSLQQLISVGLIAGGVALWAWLRRRARRATPVAATPEAIDGARVGS